MATDTIQLSRQDLYDLVWSEPVRTLATRFDISGVGLAKACRRMRIPVPGRGYWRRKATGHPVVRERLPALPVSAGLAIREITLGTRAARELTPMEPKHSAEVPDTAAARQGAYERDPAHRILVPESLEAAVPLHSLVRQTQTALRGAPPDERGLIRPFVRDGIVPWGPMEEMERWDRRRATRPPAALDITVTAAAIDRALRVLDALLKALEARGYPVYCAFPTGKRIGTSAYIASRWGDAAGGSSRAAAASLMTRVAVGDEDVFLVLREVVSKVARPVASPPTARARSRARPVLAQLTGQPGRLEYDHVGSGHLVLTIPHTPGNYPAHWVWDESRKRTGPLEEGLNDVIVAVVAAADEFRTWREQSLAKQRQAADRARVAYEQQRRRAGEAARVQLLEDEAAAWVKANHIRAYAAAVRAAEAPPVGVLPAGALADWVAWAEAHADRTDPVSCLRQALSRSQPSSRE
jgi:hypothetical protein